MKKHDLLRINDSLIKAMNYKNHIFAIAVYENKKIVENYLREFEFFNNTSSTFIEYENKRIMLCKKTCKKDQNGMEIINQGKYEIQDIVLFENEMKTLHGIYKDAIAERDLQIEKLNLLLQEDIIIPEFKKIDKSNLPEEIMTAAELFEYSFMIEN
jgi:NhaP-type Na+/H+ and K+/H+ antiporter